MTNSVNIKVEIENLPEFKKALGKYPSVAEKNFNEAIRKAIMVIEGQSKTNTPVDTGRLRGSHRMAFSKLRGEVGPDTNYMVYVHEGTSRMRARPFLENAVKSKNGEIQTIFEEALQKTLEQISKL